MAVITGTARPGEFLTSDTAGQWAINGVPLIGHTGYRLLVPWTAVPGDLITQGEVSNTVPVPAYDADAADYFSRAEGIGGSFLSAGVPGWYIKWRIDAMYRRLKDTGAWGCVVELYLMMGVGFGGLAAKAKYIATPNITWVNFVAGDHSPTGPILGLTGADAKYGNTSVQPYSQVSDDIGVGAMIEHAPSPYGVIIGNLGIDHFYSVNLTWDAIRGGITARLKSSAGSSQPRMTMPLVYGPTTAVRQGDDMIGIQGDHVEVVWPEPVSGDTNATTLHLFRRNNGSTPSYFDGRLSSQWITDGATPQQIIDLHAAASGLRDDLSRPTIAPVATPIVIRSPMKNVMRNSTGNRATVRLIDSYGEPLTGIPAGDVTITAGPEGGTAVPVAVSGSWTERSGGRYDFDMPDALYTGTERIYIEGTLVGGTVLGDCHQIVGYDRLEPWATPGDIAAIGAVIPGDDAQTLTITCTADSQPVAGVVIRIAGRRLVTDTAGVATVDLDPGTYAAKYTPPAGFDAVPDGSVTILAGPVSLPVALEAIAFEDANAPMCTVRFIASSQFGEPAEDTVVKVEFRRFAGSDPIPVVLNKRAAEKVNASGYVDVMLYRQVEYSVTFTNPRWGTSSKSLIFTTPDAGFHSVWEPA